MNNILEILYSLWFMVIMGMMLVVGVELERNQINKMVAQCEVELPRNQHCVIIAIPKGINDVDKPLRF